MAQLVPVLDTMCQSLIWITRCFAACRAPLARWPLAHKLCSPGHTCAHNAQFGPGALRNVKFPVTRGPGSFFGPQGLCLHTGICPGGGRSRLLRPGHGLRPRVPGRCPWRPQPFAERQPCLRSQQPPPRGLPGPGSSRGCLEGPRCQNEGRACVVCVCVYTYIYVCMYVYRYRYIKICTYIMPRFSSFSWCS